MNFPTFSQIASNVQNKMNQYAGGILVFGNGGVLDAIKNTISDGMELLTMQTMTVLNNTRLATSDNPSADSFFAQFQFSRLPAVAATGQVTFSRYVAASAALITPGVQVKTVDGSTIFNVTTDTGNSLWNAGMGGYLVPINTLSATVPVQAAVAGAAGNVQAGTISLISSNIAGIDLVTNNTGFTNGFDAETTAAATQRFWQFIQTRSEATQAAVEYAVATVQQGLSYSIVENPLTRRGSFNVYVDDGTGAPTSTLLATIDAAIDPVRPLTVTFQVLPPNVVYADVSLNIIAANGYTKLALHSLVAQAITAWINELGVGNSLGYYDLAAVAKSVEGVQRIENLSLNGAFQDIGGGVSDSVHVRTLVVS